MTFLWLKSPSVSVTFSTELIMREQSTQFQIHPSQRCVRAPVLEEKSRMEMCV